MPPDMAAKSVVSGFGLVDYAMLLLAFAAIESFFVVLKLILFAPAWGAPLLAFVRPQRAYRIAMRISTVVAPLIATGLSLLNSFRWHWWAWAALTGISFWAGAAIAYRRLVPPADPAGDEIELESRVDAIQFLGRAAGVWGDKPAVAIGINVAEINDPAALAEIARGKMPSGLGGPAGGY